jgi:thiol-disulfide isomerase/thioredoxin
MKYIFIAIIITATLLVNLSCSKVSRTDALTFHFNEQAVLVVKHVTNNRRHSIVGRYISFLPPDYIDDYEFTNKVSFNKTGEDTLRYKISCPTETNLIVDKKLWLPVFLVPGDTLYMTLDLSYSSKIIDRIKFKGKDASINEYKIKRHIKFPESFAEKCAALGRANLPVMKFQNSLDSTRQAELTYLNAYCKNNILPQWFIQFEKNQITYIAASNKMYYLNFRIWYKKEKKALNYCYNFLKHVKINNEQAITSLYYNFFLFQYFQSYLIDSTHKMNNYKWDQRFLRSADSLLSDDVKDVFKTYFISSFVINHQSFEQSRKIINEEKDKEGSTKYITYLENYLKDRETLKSGVKAPGFYLLDSQNNYKSLPDYKGNIILLNFWFPGCTPCRMEIPFEQKLVDNFRNKNFRLINICFYATKSTWHKVIKKWDMKGVNLYANGNWQNKLIKDYRISAYPHYTLISKNGKIISNNPKRPGKGISKEIAKLCTSTNLKEY